MHRCCWRLAVLSCVLLVSAAGGRAEEATPAEQDLVKEVARRLLAVAEPVPDVVWPPAFEIKGQDALNAYATIEVKGAGEKAEVHPRVVVFKGLITRVITFRDEGAADRLAYILGHELSHILLGHVLQRRPGQSPLVRKAFSRDDEVAADVKGMQLALAAGYSFRQARSAIDRMLELKLEYSSFEALQADHPSWKDRMTFLDKKQARLWAAMSAFHNGTHFLLCEQYVAAEGCFKRVSREFPDCAEARANLGHALLMQYCDGLDADDLRDLGVGQVVVGGFYRRPGSLEPLLRGRNEKVWEAAVEALEEALKRQPGAVPARADLGLAYLVHPSGKADVASACRHLREAAEKAAEDRALDPSARAAVLVNAGVAELAAGRAGAARDHFDRAEMAGGRPPEAGRRAPAARALGAALAYNRALLLAAPGERREAVTLLAGYLQTATPASAWWPLAYERYAGLCRELKVPARGEKELSATNRAELRLVTSVSLGPSVAVALTDRVPDIRGLGAGEAVPVVAGTRLVRVRYPEAHVEILANGGEVLAICLREVGAPPVVLQGKGLGTARFTLQVGMSKADLERLLEDEDYDFRQLDDPDVSYRFYPGLGVAVRLAKGRVMELVVAQIPRRRPPGGG
jgi:hypothetical protein